MKKIFDINKFNIIEDEENYYFFRSLEKGDIEDINQGKIQIVKNQSRLRTDRERWEEQNPGRKPRFEKNSQISLEEIYSHIKMHYSKQTNCISLSSNANVARTYGTEKDERYIIVKIPKREMGEKVFNAGPYMLEEIEKRIKEAINSSEINDETKREIEAIEQAKTEEEIKEIIKTRYKVEKPVDTSRRMAKKGITYKSPHARISNYQALDEEQTLEKNKIIAKLTILEKKGIMKPIIEHSPNNNFLIQTIGNAFSSIEQIHYGEIAGERILEISKEILDIFGLLQQVEGQNQETIKELEKEIITFCEKRKKVRNTKRKYIKKQK